MDVSINNLVKCSVSILRVLSLNLNGSNVHNEGPSREVPKTDNVVLSDEFVEFQVSEFPNNNLDVVVNKSTY